MTIPADAETSVRKTVTVNAPIERAFDVFTTGVGTWWPNTHHVAPVEIAEAVLEPRVGGRWYERGVDGTETLWGTVLDYDRPNHVAISWHINAEFKLETDSEHQSRIDVSFTSESADVTRVELVHSQLDRHGATWKVLRDGISSDGGWSALLGRFAQAAAA